METFPTAPFLHIGWDEVSTDAVAKTDSAPGFCKKYSLSPCNEANIVDHFLTELNDYAATKYKKRLMAYENVNTPGTKSNPVISNFTSNQANLRSHLSFLRSIACVITAQPWWINGGNGYKEDQVKADLHGNTLKYEALGLDTMQTAWKPRVYTRAKGVFDHAVGGSVYTHPASTGGGGAPAKCHVTEGLGYNNTNWATPNGPVDAKDAASCCQACAQTDGCNAWTFQIDPQFANETTRRWAHLTYCCWMHADTTMPITTDKTFKASGTMPHKSSQNPKGFPIPINKHMLGAEMVLWETQRGQQDKVGFLRHKAPMLAENTYAFGSDTTSWYGSFAHTFAYLDARCELPLRSTASPFHCRSVLTDDGVDRRNVDLWVRACRNRPDGGSGRDPCH